MKEEIKEETVVHKYSIFVATDGTTFDCKEECEKYEKSALGVLRSRASKLIVGKNDAWSLLGGDEYTEVSAYKISNEVERNTFLQYLFLECDWYTEERKAQIESIVDEAAMYQDVVLTGRSEGGDMYFINSRHNLINNLNNLTKDEK